MAKLCSNKGRRDNTKECGYYKQCEECRRRFNDLLWRMEHLGVDARFTQDEIDWLALYSSLSSSDKTFLIGDYRLRKYAEAAEQEEENMAKLCSSKGKGDKAGACGSYSQCKHCQYRYFYLAHMREEFGEDLVLTKEEQEWVDNVYSELSEDDLHYIEGKYSPDVVSVHRPRGAGVPDAASYNTEV